MTEALARQEPQALAYRHELTVEEVLAQADKIKQAMHKAMEEDVHFGTIPGTPKPTLFKAGAEKLCLLFRFDPQYQSAETYVGEHLAVKSVCTLWHIPTGQRFGSGEGSCSTREAKYAWRFTKRVCPSCAAEAIGKSKAEYGGGWYCNRKAGGCGASFKPGSEGAKAIGAQQEVGKVPNPDLADQYNTVLKMANKRALVAAVLNCTAASDVFTQDLEDEEAATGDETPAREELGETRREAQPDAVITKAQLTRLHAVATASKWSEAQAKALLAKYGFTSSKDVTVAKYEEIVEQLKVSPRKETAA
jgi:hypothetical protein